ncbi:MAG: universal stress protein [Desulfobacterales bacterium]|jgi:nucleotide-binding universal stress UspA family protein|nr:universal stress protein [Desulfobacterales bacterium]
MKILLAYHKVMSEDSLRLSMDLAKAVNSEVLIVTSLMFGDKGEALKPQMSEAMKRIEEVKKRFIEAGIPCESEILTRGADPGNAIVQYAKEKECNLVIIGVRLRSQVGKLLMGSTAQYVILNAHCPVLTFKEKTS